MVWDELSNSLAPRSSRTPPSSRKSLYHSSRRRALSGRHQLTKGDAITVARIEKGVPTLVTARDLVDRFHGMVRERDPACLSIWITDAANSVLASFGKGIVADRGAVNRSDDPTLVQRPNRRSNHQAQARQTANVRSRQARPAPRSPSSPSVSIGCIESESEPLFHAYSHRIDKLPP